MGLCDSTCAPDLPFAYSNACKVVKKPGGIYRIGFLKCDFGFGNIADQDEWDGAIAAGDAVWSGKILGSKPKGTFSKKRVYSCGPEQVIGGEKTMTFQDYNDGTIHDADDCAEYEFWNIILANPEGYRLVFLTCDGYIYGPIDNFSLEVDEVIEDTDQGNRYFDGALFWNDIDMLCPTYTDLSFDQDSSVI